MAPSFSTSAPGPQFHGRGSKLEDSATLLHIGSWSSACCTAYTRVRRLPRDDLSSATAVGTSVVSKEMPKQAYDAPQSPSSAPTVCLAGESTPLMLPVISTHVQPLRRAPVSKGCLREVVSSTASCRREPLGRWRASGANRV
jgi:hypothetical protein